jgi:hypothetical protein
MSAAGVRTVAAVVAVCLVASLAAGKQTKAELQVDLKDTDIAPGWIYDDIDAGFAKAAKDKRPVCIVFR